VVVDLAAREDGTRREIPEAVNLAKGNRLAWHSGWTGLCSGRRETGYHLGTVIRVWSRIGGGILAIACSDRDDHEHHLYLDTAKVPTATIAEDLRRVVPTKLVPPSMNSETYVLGEAIGLAFEQLAR
jgi:hypothetical protein